MASSEKAGEYRSSYSRCTLDPEFIPTFHKIFITTSADARQHFSHISEVRQIKMMEYALYLIMLSIDYDANAMTYQEQLGKTHDRLPIKPELYDHWLNSLITTVEHYDGKVHPTIGAVWREVLGPCIEMMKQQCTDDTVKLKAIS
jgi:hemoglobin-like flavoprotein